MSPQDDALVGRVIAEKYRIDKLVARGGFSSVYRGLHLGIDRPVAIKVLEISDTVQATWLERFSREAKVVSQLSHPNTITIFDFGQAGSDFLYIVMEYVRGRSLSRYIKKFGPVPPVRMARFAIQIARSLDEAHHMGIVHRDLKPSNVMVSLASSGEESIKVLDFGVAKLLNPEPEVDMQLTQVGAFVGTPRYASPEQLRREELDHRSDIYGLGMIMWECLVGSPAVEATDFGNCIQYHLGPDKWRIPPGIDVPDSIADIVHTCLEKDRANRYISSGQVADALEDALGTLRYGTTQRLDIPDAELEFLSETSEFGAYADGEFYDASDDPSGPRGRSVDLVGNAASSNQSSRNTVEIKSSEIARTSDDAIGGVFATGGAEDDLFGGFGAESSAGFLDQYKDDDGVPLDLLAPSPRSTEREPAVANSGRGPSSKPPVTKRRDPSPPGDDLSDWDESLADDPFGLESRSTHRSSPRSTDQSSQRSPKRSTHRDPKPQPRHHRAPATAPAARRPNANPPRNAKAAVFALFGLVALILVGVGVGVALSSSGDETTAPEIDYQKQAEAQVEELLEQADEPASPAASDGTPTISSKAIIMALAQGGWRTGSIEENDLGSLQLTSTIVRKDDMAASLTIYRTKSARVAEELLAETPSGSEGMTFGSNIVRVSPGPSRNQSGVTPVVELLYEFKTIARDSILD